MSLLRILPVLLLGALAACADSGSGGSADSFSGGDAGAVKQHFPSDFEPLCQGVALSTARKYDKATTGHKVIYFESNRDGSISDVSSRLPKDWTVVFDTKTDAYGAVDLVVCATRASQKFVKNCDGYTVDDKTSDLVVRWHTATYRVTVYEAATGKEVAAKDIAATDAECPRFYTIPDDVTKVDDFAAPPEEKVVAFVKPFVQP